MTPEPKKTAKALKYFWIWITPPTTDSHSYVV